MKTLRDYYNMGYKDGIKASTTTMGRANMISNNIDSVLAHEAYQAEQHKPVVYKDSASDVNPTGLIDCLNTMSDMVNEDNPEYNHVKKDMKSAVEILQETLVRATSEADNRGERILSFDNNPDAYDRLFEGIDKAREKWIRAYTKFKPASVVEW